jgi:hypothetical protein
MLKNKSLLNFKKPVIEFNERKYIFSVRSLVLLAVGAPISAYLIYLFFDMESQFWLHEVVVKQTAYLLNLLFDMGVSTEYTPVGWNPSNLCICGSDYFYTP